MKKVWTDDESSILEELQKLDLKEYGGAVFPSLQLLELEIVTKPAGPRLWMCWSL